MNRTELIEAVSGDTGLTRQQSEAALDAIVYEITSGVRSGNPVRVTGFGTFKLRERQARRGRNPQTGAAVRIKASKGIGFSAGVKLKSDLNARGAVAKPKSIVPATKAPATKAPAKKAASATRATSTRASATKKTPAAKAPAAKRAVAKRTVAKKAAPAKRTTATKSAPAAKRVASKRVAKRG
ncbi:MAG: DNA-binding protein [Acidimicrobiaceae bacterium]|nr:DNA-binding protein [Acidimicrobiaceae bacterium]